jgi:ABC-type Fe3+-hydroxamate transport system substrate-binding protein
MRRMRWVIQATLVLCMLGCGGSDAPSAESPARSDRVVSLSPALTATMLRLGWSGRMAGRTPWCEGVSEVPVIGSLTEVDLERLARIDPSVILVQRTSLGLPPGLERAASERGWRVEQIPCETLADVRALPEAVGEALSERPELEAWNAAWTGALTVVPELGPRGRAVLLLPDASPRACGADAYLGQVWSAWGGTVCPASPGWPSMQLEDVVACDPDRVVVLGAASPAWIASLERHGMTVERNEDPRLLRPGPDLLEAVLAWRARMTGSP